MTRFSVQLNEIPMRSRRCVKLKSREFDAFCSRPCSDTHRHCLIISHVLHTRAWCVRFIAFSATIHATRFIFHVCRLKCRFIYFCSEKLLKVALHLFVRKTEKDFFLKFSTFCCGFIVSEANPEAISMCICRHHVPHCSPSLRYLSSSAIRLNSSCSCQYAYAKVPNAKHLK